MPYADPQKRRAYLQEYRRKNFDRLSAYDKVRKDPEKRREYQKAYHEKHREKARAASQEYRRLHLEELQAYDRVRGKSERRRAQNNACRRKRAKNPRVRVVMNLRRRVFAVLKGQNKSAATLTLLGCSAAEWKAHLEGQFRPGMTWENYGPVWHVDHKRPLSSFNMADPEQQRAALNWENTQPLFWEENLKKGAKLTPPGP